MAIDFNSPVVIIIIKLVLLADIYFGYKLLFKKEEKPKDSILDEPLIKQALDVVGVATFKAGDVYIDQRLFVGGVELSAGAGGGSIFSGITTFTNTTNNTLGDVNTGSVQLDGGLGVAKNLTVGAGLSIGATLNVAGLSTFTKDVDINAALDVDGHTELDELNVTGVSTFSRIVGAATTNIIPFLYSTMGDLPSASTYHGAFAHVHGTGKAYYAHANNWSELVSKELNGTIGIGTERLNVGRIVSTGINVSGITTTTSLNVGTGATIITTTQTSGGLVGINSTAPTSTLDVGGVINSNTDITINGTSVLAASTNDAVALAIALG